MDKKKIVDKEMLTRIKAEYQYKYSVEMDEWFAMIINELNCNFETFNNTVIEASEKIKKQVNQVNFSNRKEALWYGLGLTFPFSVAIIFIALIVGYFKSQDNKYQDLRSFIRVYPHFESYRTFVANSSVVKENGLEYLVLKPAASKENINVGKEYQKIKKGMVYIPLRVDSK